MFCKMKFLFVVFVFAVCRADGAGVGESCNLNGSRGVCRNIYSCPSALEDIKNKKPPPPRCGWEGNDVVVCCKIEQATTTARNPVLTTTKRSSVPSTTEYTPKEYTYVDVDNKQGSGGCEPIPPIMTSKPTGQKAWDKCIEYQEKYVFPCEKGVSISGDLGRVNRCHHNADELIIGGIAAAQYEFPHMALLGYLNDQNKIDWECGGTLISEKFLLTAGHCIINKLGFDVSHAKVGTLRRSDKSTVYGIRRIIPHVDYNLRIKYNDIALLELNQSVPLDHTLVPACLHTGNSVDDSRASATGWGTTVYNKDANADILQKVVLTQFTASECSTVYEPNRHMLQGVDARTQVCYGDRTKSRDTCQGDSGGPLQVKNKKIGCMYTVVGVTSFGQACGFIGVPGIYTRVAPYLSWIEGIVWPN